MSGALKSAGAVLLCAGASERMGFDKLAISVGSYSPIERCLMAFCRAQTRFSHIVAVTSGNSRKTVEALLERYKDLHIIITDGGASRGRSVLNGLRASRCNTVAIHDAARCLVTPELIDACIESAALYGSGIAALEVRDTLRRADGGVIDRSGAYMMQTPQAFDYDSILAAYLRAEADGSIDGATDDCAAYTASGETPRFVKGTLMNQKLTVPGDMEFFHAAASYCPLRAGIGEDTHALVAGRQLVLGGVEIPFELGLLGHSDADVLVHAIIDALLGAAALGDIGAHFPDSDERYRGISSLELLARVRELVAAAGYGVVNVDAVIVAQAPKLRHHIARMRENIAAALQTDAARISVKATTPEHMGPEGNMECMTARAVCMLSC